MKCWYCGKKLGRIYYKVPGMLGRYCYRCALKLCDKDQKPIKVKDE